MINGNAAAISTAKVVQDRREAVIDSFLLCIEVYFNVYFVCAGKRRPVLKPGDGAWQRPTLRDLAKEEIVRLFCCAGLVLIVYERCCVCIYRLFAKPKVFSTS